jgi:hypothetical protein
MLHSHLRLVSQLVSSAFQTKMLYAMSILRMRATSTANTQTRGPVHLNEGMKGENN